MAADTQAKALLSKKFVINGIATVPFHSMGWNWRTVLRRRLSAQFTT
jgi:hypothetical protein